MRANQETIKKAAKLAKKPIGDFIVLAHHRDPYYVGTPTDIKNAEWFANIWQRAGYLSGAHLRRVHYWIVSQRQVILMPDGLPYENTEKCWEGLGKASMKARYLGMVNIADILDNKNPDPHVHADYSTTEPNYGINVPEFDNPYIHLEGFNVADAQPYHLEVWCEKSTMNDVFMPLCDRYNANLVTFEGEVSLSACNDLIARIKSASGKPARVFYISDFDPAGNSMPVAMSRKVEYLLDLYGCDFDVRINALVLTAETIQEYNLPRKPIKDTENRGEAALFGNGAVELDALEALYPGELGNIVNAALSEYYNQAVFDEVMSEQEALRQSGTRQD
ncbi:MAG: hypothetical protein H0X30_29960 [Anaerolineae bacterium]|nr:hypothetical protein [Anaerolineae bacterium]